MTHGPRAFNFHAVFPPAPTSTPPAPFSSGAFLPPSLCSIPLV